MIRFATVLALLLLLPAAGALAAGPASSQNDSKSFRWATKCSEIPTPRIALCRIIPDVEQGTIYFGPYVPLFFQIDSQRGRSISIVTDQNCMEQPAMVHFGSNSPFTIRGRDSLEGALFDRAVAEFRAAKTGTVEYSALPDCKRVTATFYYSNLDDALAKAVAFVGAGGS